MRNIAMQRMTLLVAPILTILIGLPAIAQEEIDETRQVAANGEADATLDGTEQIDLSTVNGDIELRLNNSASPRIEDSAVSGDLELTLDSQISARFSLNTHAGGRIENHLTDEETTDEKYGPARHLDFSTGSGSEMVELNSVSGELTLSSH